MLRDDSKKPPVYEKPMEKPMEKPVYEPPMYEDFECPKPPMMPMYPNNMYPCPYLCPCPYPQRDMYGDRPMDLEEMMRINPMLRKCIMGCIEKYSHPRNPCMPPSSSKPKLMPRKKPQRNPYLYGLEEYDIYEENPQEMEVYEFEESEIDID